MAKELMEIGGFITSGAEIVNHDNSLSGNGTVDSPLGVVPGYNETVLWDGTSSPVAVTSGNNITLSELASNFERILVCCGSTDGSWSVYNEFPPFATRWEVVRWSEDGSSYVIRDGCLLTKDSTDGTKWNCIKGRRMQWNSNNTWSMTAYNTFYIYRVVGINRIANN